MGTDIEWSDGWYAPDTGPAAEQEPIVRLARWILHAELAGDAAEVRRVMEQQIVPLGLAAVYTAMVAWCDHFAAHALGSGNLSPPDPLQLDVGQHDRRPHVRWAVRLLRARAAWDRATWAALIDEMSGDKSLHVSALLSWVSHHLQHARFIQPPPRPQVQIETVPRGAAHAWRDCRLRVVRTPELDPDDAELVQGAVDIVWRQLPGSDRRLLHGYLCHQRRDATSRQVFAAFNQQMDTVLGRGNDAGRPGTVYGVGHKSYWPLVQPTGDGVKLDLPADQWSADPPGARLRMIATPVAFHDSPGWAHVEGMRWTAEYCAPVMASVCVRVDALPAEIQTTAPPRQDDQATGDHPGRAGTPPRSTGSSPAQRR